MEEFNFLTGSINKEGPWFHASGKGLSVMSLNTRTGLLRHILDYPFIENAIWLKQTSFGYLAASEQYLQNGKIFSFTIDRNMRCIIIGPAQESNGGAICHIEIVEEYNLIIATSFLGGMSLHTYDEKGIVSPCYQTVNYPGKSVKPMQEKSHPHQVTLVPNKKQILVCDLGNDTIWKHNLRIKNGKTYLDTGEPQLVNIGSGPRHLAFHPTLPIFYLLGQLDGRVTTYDYDQEEIHLRNSLPVLPSPFTGEMSAAAIKIHPSNRTIYMSERQNNMIAVFEINCIGDLKGVCYFSCYGMSPRDFLFSEEGDWLLVLNHDSDSITSFRVNPVLGIPDVNPVEIFPTGCPVCCMALTDAANKAYG